MPLKLKLNTLAVLALAVLFNQFFSFTKHDPALAAIIPFADDPYDAIGSIAMIMSALLAILSLVHVIRFRRDEPLSALNQLFVVRTQAAVALGVLVALGADAVAMARHLSAWAGKPAANELLGLMAGMAAVSLGVLCLALFPAGKIGLRAIQQGSRKVIFTVVICVIALALFPEFVIQNVLLHFLAILLGFVLFFAPLSALIVALLPSGMAESRIEGGILESHRLPWVQWGGVAILGLAVGACALMAEFFSEGGGSAPTGQTFVVSAVFIGAGTSALLLAFAFLRKPLGLFRKTSH